MIFIKVFDQSIRPVMLALLCATAQSYTVITRASVVRPSSVRPSDKPIFSETVKLMNTKFGGMARINHIFRLIF